MKDGTVFKNASGDKVTIRGLDPVALVTKH